MPAKSFDIDEFREHVSQWLTLDDWRMLREVLELIDTSDPDAGVSTNAKQRPVRSWKELAKRVGRNRVAVPRRLEQIEERLQPLVADNEAALIDENDKHWTLTDLGQRVLAAAVSLLNSGLEVALDILCGRAGTSPRPLVISAAEAVSTYLLPHLPDSAPRYELLPWTPYMTTRAAADLLLTHRADLVITWADGGTAPGSIEVSQFGLSRGIRVLVHHTHPLVQRWLGSKRPRTPSVPDLAAEAFAAPLDTHLAATAHALIDALGGNLRVVNVGRFPQAVTHVQLTRTFSIFPDWPWCLRSLRKSAGILSFPLDGLVSQEIKLRAMWRAGKQEPSGLVDLRRAVETTYALLCSVPSWELTPLADQESAFPDAKASPSRFYFHTPLPCAVAPIRGWVTAQIVWAGAMQGTRSGTWDVVEDRRSSIAVTLRSVAGGVFLQMTGTGDLAFFGSGILTHVARPVGKAHPDGQFVTSGSFSFRAAGGELVTTACILSSQHIDSGDLTGIQEGLNDLILIG